MTSIFSSNMFKYFRYRLFSRKAPLILLLVLNVLSYPLLFGTMLIGTQSIPFYNMIYSSFVICVISLMIIFATGFYIAISSFDYFHNKNVVDMNMSLPLTSGQRFFADYFAGLAMYTIPYIISSLIGIILYSITSNIGFKNLILSYYWSNPITASVTVIEAMQYMFAGLIAMVMLYSLVVLVSSFCGSVVETTIYSLVINIALPVGAFVAALVVFYDAFGIDANSVILQIVGATSPIGELLSAISGRGLYIMYVAEESKAILSLPIILCNLIFIALCIVGAYFASKYRKAEQVGKPFVYRAAYHAIMALILFSIVCPFVMQTYQRFTTLYSISRNNEGWTLAVTMVITTFIVFMVFDIITGRGFKKILRGLLRYALTVLGCVAASALLIAADGFGISEYVPEASGVESVTVGYQSVNVPFYELQNNTSLVIKDSESIEKITKIHNDAIFLYKRAESRNAIEFGGNYDNCTHVTLQYKMKNGEIVYRYYEMKRNVLDELKAMPVTEETKLARYNLLAERMLDEQDIYPEIGFTVFDTSLCREANVKISRDAFLEALKKDILAETDEQFHAEFLPAATVKILTNIVYYENYNGNREEDSEWYYDFYHYYIKPSYTNVIALFRDNGAGSIFTGDFTDFYGDFSDCFIRLYKTGNEEYSSYSDTKVEFNTRIPQDDRIKELLKKCYVSYNYYDYYEVPNRYYVMIWGKETYGYLIVPRELYSEADRLMEESTGTMSAFYPDGIREELLGIAGIAYEQQEDGMLEYSSDEAHNYNQHAENVLIENGYKPDYYDSSIACAFSDDGRYIIMVTPDDGIVMFDTYTAKDREYAAYAEDTEVA